MENMVLSETNEILFNNNQTPFKIKESMVSSIKDIIYVIKCAECNKQYIGKTGSLRDRVGVHKQDIFTPYFRNPYVSHHIAHCAIDDYAEDGGPEVV